MSNIIVDMPLLAGYNHIISPFSASHEHKKTGGQGVSRESWFDDEYRHSDDRGKFRQCQSGPPQQKADTICAMISMIKSGI